jgi:hypothetical protein
LLPVTIFCPFFFDELKRIIEEEEIKRKDENTKRKDEEIKKIMEEKEKENKKKDEEIYKISKIAWSGFLGEGFEVENGVLGLERNIYLNVFKL